MTIVYNLNETDYHNDDLGNTDVPTLNQTTARILLNKSPKHAFHQHPKLGGARVTPTDAMNTGNLFHALLLDAGPEIVECDFNDWRTNHSKEAKAEAHANGKIPVLSKVLLPARKIAKRIQEELASREIPIVFDGQSEVSLYWEEHDSTGRAVQCRGRVDHLPSDRHIIYDIKTGADIAPQKLVKSIFTNGYDIQAAAYTSAWSKETGLPLESIRYVLVFIEPDEPNGIVVGQLSAEYLAIGRQRWQRAIEVWSRCLHSKEWPDYENGHDIEFWTPGWVAAQAEEDLAVAGGAS